MPDPAWLEVRAVLRCDPELVDAMRSLLDDSDLVEVNRIDVTRLDDDLRRWDGARPPGVVVDRPLASGGVIDATKLHLVADRGCSLGMPEPAPTTHPVFDALRRGHNLPE